MNPQKLEKWNRWLGDANSDGSIAHELTNLALIREIHSGLRQMVSDNKNLQVHSAFYSVMQQTYSQSALMYIRRQVKRDKDSVGLIMLANDILENSELFTKDFYLGLYVQNRPKDEHDTWKRLGARDFDKYFGGNLGDSLDPNVIIKDVQEMEKVLADSSGFVDQRIAHLDKREPTNIPLHSEIESWCLTLNRVLKKYMLLVRATDYKIEPVLKHDWKTIFRAAWL